MFMQNFQIYAEFGRGTPTVEGVVTKVGGVRGCKNITGHHHGAAYCRRQGITSETVQITASISVFCQQQRFSFPRPRFHLCVTKLNRKCTSLHLYKFSNLCYEWNALMQTWLLLWVFGHPYKWRTVIAEITHQQSFATTGVTTLTHFCAGASRHLAALPLW